MLRFLRGKESPGPHGFLKDPMNNAKYQKAYEAAQAGGMNNTDCDEFARDQSERKMFGRIGTRFILNQQMVAAGAAGAILTEDKDAGTVEAKSPTGEIVFRALHKGGNVWLIMYSEAFYPKQ